MSRLPVSFGALVCALAFVACGDDEKRSAGGLDPSHGAFVEGFTLAGLVGDSGARANAMLRGPDGHVYVAGNFTLAGGVSANNVARWDGTDWQALGDGVAGMMYALAFDADGALYAAGDMVDGTSEPENRLMRWDGTSWTAMPGAIAGTVFALAARPTGGVYVAGNFFDVAGTGAHGIAYFDGSDWAQISGPGVSDARAIDVTGDDSFCIGGLFNEIDGDFGGEVGALGGDFEVQATAVLADNVACFDGTSWSQLGDGLPGMVSVLVRDDNGDYFAGGTLTYIRDFETGAYEAGLAKLSSGVWDIFEGGVDGGFINDVRAISFIDGDMYIGGTFSGVGIGDLPAKNLARYRDGNWESIGFGVTNNVGFVGGWTVGVNAFLKDGDSILLAGLFSSADESPWLNIARWRDSDLAYTAVASTEKMFAGLNGLLEAIQLSPSGALYAGGLFSAAGSVAASNVAVLRNGVWEPLGFGLDSTVLELLVVSDTEVYAGGDFWASLAAEMPFLARYDGESWNPVGDMLNGSVHALLRDDITGDLYVGGDFTYAGELAVNYIARWDGAAWHAVGAGFDAPVRALAWYQGRLVAAGFFDASGETSVPAIGELRDGAWVPVGGGLVDNELDYGSVLAVYGDYLVLGGAFTTIEGVACDGLARFDGKSWKPLGATLAYGEEMPGVVSALLPVENVLFVSGAFTRAGEVEMKNVGYFDGKAWHELGGGMSDLASAFVVDGQRLWIGGPFTLAGGTVSMGIARYEWE